MPPPPLRSQAEGALAHLRRRLEAELGGEFTVRLDSWSPTVVVFERVTFDRFSGRRQVQHLNLSVGSDAGPYLRANQYSPAYEAMFERVVHEFRAADEVEQEIERRVRERLRGPARPINARELA